MKGNKPVFRNFKSIPFCLCLAVLCLLFFGMAGCKDNYSLNVEDDDIGYEKGNAFVDDDMDLDSKNSGSTDPDGFLNPQDADKENDSEIVDEPLRYFTFQSAEDVENLTDEELLYLYYHEDEYIITDFIDVDIEENVYDTFGVPLLEWEFEGEIKRERFDWRCLRPNIPYEEMNLDEPMPEELFLKYANAFCEDYIAKQGNYDNDSKTGKKIQDEEIIFCGINDFYAEYSVRYTEVRSYYNNNILVSKKIPRAIRFLFYRNWIQVETPNALYPVYFGEFTLEKKRTESDMTLANNYYPVYYREFAETEEAIITTYYGLELCGGDYGLSDSIRLVKYTLTYDKKKHKEDTWEERIKELAIPGTYHEWPQ